MNGHACGSGYLIQERGRKAPITENEKFIESSQYLFGSAANDDIDLSKETHKFEFSHRLPSFIPYSIERPFGYVRYNVEAILCTVMPTNDQHAVLEFSVERREDLNDFPELKLPLLVENSNYFSHIVPISKPVGFTISLPKRGYACGEAIFISLNVINNSSVNIDRIIIALVRFYQFCDNDEAEKTRELIAKVQTRGVKARHQGIINELVRVPCDAIPSNEKYCRVIKVKYELVLKIKTDAWYKMQALHVPITIGTVELRNDNSYAESASLGPSAATSEETILTLDCCECGEVI